MACQTGDRDHDWGNNYVFLDHVHSTIANIAVFRPTAGFKALMHLLHTCEEVSVFGFGPGCNGEVGRRYYPGGVAILPSHSYGEEFDLLHQAARDPGALLKGEDGTAGWILAKKVTLKLPSCATGTTLQKLLAKLGAAVSLRVETEGAGADGRS